MANSEHAALRIGAVPSSRSETTDKSSDAKNETHDSVQKRQAIQISQPHEPEHQREQRNHSHIVFFTRQAPAFASLPVS